jgi:subfamily B ATP-binding cassette protein MsbA
MFGIVSQETMLFNDTIANNIRYGYSQASDEEIIEASKVANAYSFISKLPSGFNTFVGDRGVMLSGGERQRIAIARALIRNPYIIIFDEATSALDAESERIVQEAITDSLRDRTAVIVAHRLATIIDCDEIIVFDGGRIIERGSHKELFDMNGIYRRLYDIQFSTRE